MRSSRSKTYHYWRNYRLPVINWLNGQQPLFIMQMNDPKMKDVEFEDRFVMLAESSL